MPASLVGLLRVPVSGVRRGGRQLCRDDCEAGQNRPNAGSLQGLRPGQAIDVSDQPGVPEGAKHHLRMLLQVACVAGHQGNAGAGSDNSGGYAKLVDPVHDPRLTASHTGNHRDGVLQREAFLDRYPVLVCEVCRLDCRLGSQGVAAPKGQIEGFTQDRNGPDRGGPGWAADEPLREHEVMVGGQFGKVILRDVEVAQPDGWLAGTLHGRCQAAKDGCTGTVERSQGNGSRLILPKPCHRLACPGQGDFHLDCCCRQRPPGVGENRAPPVLSGQGQGCLPLQGADLLGDRRGSDVQSCGGGCNAAPLTDLPQSTQLTQFHKVNLMYGAQNQYLVLSPDLAHAGQMMTLLRSSRADLLLLLVAAAWGSTYLVAKELVTPSSVPALLALRMLCAGAVLAVIVAARHQRVSAPELRVGVILGLLLAAVFALETFGLVHTSATNAGLIISLTIVFTPVLDAAVSGRRLSGRFLLAGVVAVAGVALLAGNGALRPPGLGDVLILGAALVRAVHVTAMAKLTRDVPMDSVRLTAVQLTTCAAVFSAGSLWLGDSIPHYVSSFGRSEVLLFAYLVLGCTVFAFLVQTWAVRRTSPSRVSLLLGTEPLWAAFIGVTVAHDSVAVSGYFGIALILAGVAWGRVLDQSGEAVPGRAAPADSGSRRQ